MNQRDVEQLSAYLDGQLDSSASARLESRLASDPALASALDALRESRALLRRMPKRRAPRNFTLTPKMVGLKPPLPRAYPVLRFATAFAAFLFAVSFIRIGPIALGASAPAPEYGIGGGPNEPAALEVEAAPTEPPVVTEAPAATEPPMQAISPEPTATAQPTAGPLPTEMGYIPPAPAPTGTYDQNRAAEPPSGTAAKSAVGTTPTPEPFALSEWQIAFGVLTLLGIASLFLLRRLAARKWRNQ